jgi:hypothetical protein
MSAAGAAVTMPTQRGGAASSNGQQYLLVLPVKTRRRLLVMLTSENIPVGGMHLNFPRLIRIRRDGRSLIIKQL